MLFIPYLKHPRQVILRELALAGSSLRRLMAQRSHLPSGLVFSTGPAAVGQLGHLAAAGLRQAVIQRNFLEHEVATAFRPRVQQFLAPIGRHAVSAAFGLVIAAGPLLPPVFGVPFGCGSR